MNIIIGSKYKDEIAELTALGYNILPFNASDKLHEEIAYHTDINFFKCNNEYLIINEDIDFKAGEQMPRLKRVFQKGISSPYPYDIGLNAVILGNKLICNAKNTSQEILGYAQRNNITVINTNQGYCKCSICVVNDNAVITEDNGIASLLKNYQIDVLKIESGFVGLSDKHYGFIGGASGLLSANELYFSGDISSHPEYREIADFLNKYNVKPIFNKIRKLNDFGGFVLI